MNIAALEIVLGYLMTVAHGCEQITQSTVRAIRHRSNAWHGALLRHVNLVQNTGTLPPVVRLPLLLYSPLSYSVLPHLSSPAFPHERSLPSDLTSRITDIRHNFSLLRSRLTTALLCSCAEHAWPILPVGSRKVTWPLSSVAWTTQLIERVSTFRLNNSLNDVLTNVNNGEAVKQRFTASSTMF